MAELSKDLRWGVVFFTLNFSASLLGEFAPCKITVSFTPLTPLSLPCQVVWDPWAKKRKREPKGWDLNLDNLDDDDIGALEDDGPGEVLHDQAQDSSLRSGEERRGSVLRDLAAACLFQVVESLLSCASFVLCFRSGCVCQGP